jgi:hypothetical protein
MQTLIRKLSDVVYSGDNFVSRWRAQRMSRFLELVNPPPRARIVDLGGTAHLWTLIDHEFAVTLVNLPGTYDLAREKAAALGVTLVEADACDMHDRFEDQSFDVVFSNSVIEHVGDAAKQDAFAREVRRLAPAYWVQTPSDRFPIEPHTGVPYYWRLPEPARVRLQSTWKRRLPAWAEFIQGTRVLSRARMQELFPNAELYVENKLGFEKSYACFAPSRPVRAPHLSVQSAEPAGVS